MKNEKHLYQSIYQTLPALLILLTIYTALMRETARAQNPPPTGIKVTAQNDFGEKFRAGRDLIDRQEWARATEQFREAIENNPDHKLADAALYWLAFCYKKQKKFEEADAALDRLFKEFPASPWTLDAQVMKTEIAPALGRLYDARNNNPKKNRKNPQQDQFSSDLQAQIITENVSNSSQNLSLEEKLALTDRLPLERADEIKLAAFQSLLVADPRRAIETIGEVLKPESKAREALKREILRVWRKPRLFASNTLTDNITKTIGGKEFVSLLRETLVKSFQNEKNLKIRVEIIYTLASLADEQSLDYLKQIYATENERDIKKDIINSFGSSSSVFYPSGSDIAQKQKGEPDIAREQNRKIQLDFLLEIVRAEKDLELRRLAFSNLRHFKNWSGGAQAVEVMTRLYDAETDEEFKLAILRTFGESKQPAATRKLLDIAKNDKSDKLRVEAIYSLRTSKDPEVLKFLEDLIK